MRDSAGGSKGNDVTQSSFVKGFDAEGETLDTT